MPILNIVPHSFRAACVAFWLTACAVYPEQGVAAFGGGAQLSDSPSPRATLLAGWHELRGDPYPLDDFERWLPPGESVKCDQKGMVTYRGTKLRYAGSVLVDPAFGKRLREFEEVAAQAARQVYGREPRLVRHYGVFSCRATRNRRHVVSEHALGNALDLVGFDFGAAAKAQPLPDGLPKRLRGPFQVRVARHWQARNVNDTAAAAHARFFALLTDRLKQRSDIFRSMYGPGHGGHDDHLHLDAAPWRYVDL